MKQKVKIIWKERVCLHTSASAHAASTFTDQFGEQVPTPAPSPLMTPFHGDPSLPLRSEISDPPITPDTRGSLRSKKPWDHNPKLGITSWDEGAEHCFFLMMGWRTTQGNREPVLFLSPEPLSGVSHSLVKSVRGTDSPSERGIEGAAMRERGREGAP